jgi:protein dithiol oxidoreductase (disulfide-forming)
MKRRDAAIALTAAALAPTSWAQGGPPVEGTHYMRLNQALPGTPGKIEVIEFFFYRCPHCDAFEPLVEAWVARQAADVSFRRVPVGRQAVQQLHQRMYYALEAMGALSPAIHVGIFNALHRGGVEANDEAAVVALVGRLGVDRAKFKQALGGFSVQNKLNQGMKLLELAGTPNVPALIIGGRWRTSPGLAGPTGQSEAIQGKQALVVADFLIKKARAGKSS